MNMNNWASTLILPNDRFAGYWESIIVDPELKSRLLNRTLLSFTLRRDLPPAVTALHGLILLVGPPGTGKTTLARGLGQTLAKTLHGGLRFVEVNAHELMSAEHGQSQRAVSRLLGEHLPGIAEAGPTIALLDEVETLAVARAKTSLEANPVDVHRATDAVLTALDRNADESRNLLYIATSNFPEALDDALRSRADATFEIPLPDAGAILKILEHGLDCFGNSYPKLARLVADDRLKVIAKRLVGADGRQIRKLIVEAMSVRSETAADPNQLTHADIVAAADDLARLIANKKEVSRGQAA